MAPGTLIVLFALTASTVTVCLLALLFPRKTRKVIWFLACSGFLFTAGFYAVRPFIVKYQKANAVETLTRHLEENYPNEDWRIEYHTAAQLQSEFLFPVIFLTEQEVVYRTDERESPLL